MDDRDLFDQGHFRADRWLRRCTLVDPGTEATLPKSAQFTWVLSEGQPATRHALEDPEWRTQANCHLMLSNARFGFGNAGIFYWRDWQKAVVPDSWRKSDQEQHKEHDEEESEEEGE